MRFRFFGIILFLCLVFQHPGYAAFDNQYWTNIGITKSLSPKYTLDFSEEIKWGNDYSEMYLHRTDLNLGINISKKLKVAFAIKQINIKSQVWSQVRSSYIDVQFTLGNEKLQFKDRNRFEYLMRKAAENIYRYRNKATLSANIVLFGKNWTPYIAEEFFYDINIAILKFNRFYTGIQFMLSNRIKTDLFYLLEHKKHRSNYLTHHILGTTLRYQF